MNDEIEMNAVACSDSEGMCSERVVFHGDSVGGTWQRWRGGSEAGRYACGFAHATPTYGWLDDDKGMIGLKFMFCKNDHWEL